MCNPMWTNFSYKEESKGKSTGKKNMQLIEGIKESTPPHQYLLHKTRRSRICWIAYEGRKTYDYQ